MISNCGKDENNKYHGGKAGDQTGKEYQLINWYSRPWKCVLRHPNAAVQEELAKLGTAAAKNNLIGYDQYQRLTFYNALSAAGWDPAAVKVACEADCSSSTSAIIIAVGHRLGIAELQNVNKSNTTSIMRKDLIKAGFELLTDKKYLTSDLYLLPGDILLNDGAHVAINVTKGAKVGQSCTSTDKTQSGGTQSTSGALISKLQGAKYKDASKAGAYKTTTGLNLRFGPGKDKYASMVVMPAGTVCRNYGYYSKDAAGEVWLYVVATVNGKQYTGYAKESYLRK